MTVAFHNPVVSAGVQGLPGLFEAGRTTPLEVLDVYMARIERLNPALNAFLTVDEPGARDAAKASQARWAAGVQRSALDGAPIAIKANIAVAGLPWHAGIAAYRDRIAAEDAACVAALRDAGAVILGLVNMHEAALGATNDNRAFGRCENPYRHGFTPGGSSGGSACAVAAGLCAAALGTDTLGSVRIPAGYCGVFGHKPTHRLAPISGVAPLSWTLDDVGVLARSADDAASVLAALSGAAAKASFGAEADPPGRCAVLELDGQATLDPAVAAAFAATLEAAREQGLQVEPLRLTGWDVAALRRASLLIVEVEALAEHEARLGQDPEGFSPTLRSMLQWAQRQPPTKLAKAYRALAEAAAQVRLNLSGFDAILTPTTAAPAFPFDAAAPADQADFTVIANITGLAATAFPIGLTASGLPLSAQVISRSDRTALSLANRLARPTPKPPAFCD